MNCCVMKLFLLLDKSFNYIKNREIDCPTAMGCVNIKRLIRRILMRYFFAGNTMLDKARMALVKAPNGT